MKSYVIYDIKGNILRAASNVNDDHEVLDSSSEFELVCDWPYDLENYKVEGGQLTLKTAQDLLDEEEPRLWPNLKAKRNQMLQSTDWTQVPDAPVDHAAWAVYRQELRDLPANTEDPRNVVWPTPPN